VRAAGLKKYPHSTSAQVHSVEVAVVGGVVLVALIGIGLWLWMAWANGRGKNWARIVATVLFGINTLDLLLSVSRPHAVLSLLLSLLTWLAGLGAIVFLWRSESSAYFSAGRTA
jgi:UDP-N-acetylmuramyl pentapeptide phosphotransferase/UDP-N-acetylglucosamine-1-phosphate transferase